MGVPGLWRILDLASQPLSLERCSGMKIAIDIHSHLNRILHGNHGGNWLFYVLKDLFVIMHYNIKVVVVFQGKRPLSKMFSYLLGDDSTDLSYNRVQSALIRAAAQPDVTAAPPETREKEPIATKTLEQIQKESPKRKTTIQIDMDPVKFSQAQLNKVSKTAPPKTVAVLSRPDVSAPFLLYKKNQPEKDKPKETEEAVPANIPVPALPKPKAKFSTPFLDSLKDILPQKVEPSGEELVIKKSSHDDFEPVSLLPSDNPYLAPAENYVTAEHLRALYSLLDLLDVPYINAPEEAAAQCAFLEMEGIVDAVASDDNNSILFGSSYLIRNIFLSPHCVLMKSLIKHGITRKRLINLTMMIDGDYNADIRRRLFTVGPIRGLEILSYFPNEKIGLHQFKEWWVRVVKNGCAETNPFLQHFSKSRWLRRLVVPGSFPPENLLQAFIAPSVVSVGFTLHSPKIKPNELLDYVERNCNTRRTLIEEYIKAFSERSKTFVNSMTFMKWIDYDISIPENMKVYFDLIENFDKKSKQNFLSDSDEDSVDKENEDPLSKMTDQEKVQIRREVALQKQRELQENIQNDEDETSDDSILPPRYIPSPNFLSSESSQVINDNEQTDASLENATEESLPQKESEKTNSAQKEIDDANESGFEDVSDTIIEPTQCDDNPQHDGTDHANDEDEDSIVDEP